MAINGLLHYIELKLPVQKVLVSGLRCLGALSE